MEKRRYNETQNKATQRYHAAHMEIVTFRAQKSKRYNDRIARAAAMHGQSKAQYMQAAIDARLDADGVTVDSLPPPD